MDDDFGADADLLEALAASEAATSRRQPQPQPRPGPRIQQPTPQRLDRAPPPPPPQGGNASSTNTNKIVQPTPQALPTRSSGSSILVSPRQKGNPVLTCLRSTPWEYSDIPADYGLGLTTCALFLSLKYHRLHPEYIYTRIRNLKGKYNLRILLTMVDIPNHEDSLRELAKTSLVNNVTVMLCWSAQEAARYLELYKSYEHANFSAIKGVQAEGYAERLVEFVTVPRAINKADAVSLVSTFGSLRNAVNADPEQVSGVGGWGEKKVKAWCKAVEAPFRVTKAKKRGVTGKAGGGKTTTAPSSSVLEAAVPIGRVPLRDMARTGGTTQAGSSGQPAKDVDDDEDIEAMMAAAEAESSRQAKDRPASAVPSRNDDQLDGGIAAALAKLRETGG